MEDEVVSKYAFSQLEECANSSSHDLRTLCPKKMTINMTGFMENQTTTFMTELWELLLSAQKEPSGIPQQLIREKLDEKQRKMVEIEKAQEKLQKIRDFNQEPVSKFSAPPLQYERL